MQITSSQLRKELIELLDKREDKAGKYWEISQTLGVQRKTEHTMLRRIVAELSSEEKISMKLTSEYNLELKLIG